MQKASFASITITGISLGIGIFSSNSAFAASIGGYSVSSVARFNDAGELLVVNDSQNFYHDTPEGVSNPTTVSSLAKDSFDPAGNLKSGIAYSHTTGAAGLLRAYAYSALFDGAQNSQTHTYLNVLDEITVSSKTLPVGSLVALPVRIKFDGFATPIKEFELNGNLFGKATASVFFTGPSFSANYDTSMSLLGSGPYFNYPVLGTIYTTVGQAIEIGYGLSTFVDIHAGSPIHEAEINFDHTAQFFIDAPQDIVLSASSGHNYASSTTVPTPALLPGLVSLGIAALRKRKAVRSEL